MERGIIREILCCSWLLLIPATAFADAAYDQILIVRSTDNAYFSETIDTLLDHVDDPARFSIVDAGAIGRDRIEPPPNSLFVALGEDAITAVAGLALKVESVNAYVTREQFRSLDTGPRDTTILLDQPLARYLAFCKIMLDIESLGIVEHDTLILEPAESSLLERLDLELRQYRVDARHKLLPTLRRLLAREDALLMLPRQAIYNRETLKGVLLTSYRNRKPVISYSPAHVRAGALASIYSSPVDIGRHLALEINRRLEGAGDDARRMEFARFYSIATNRTVARSLGIQLPEESAIRFRLERLLP